MLAPANNLPKLLLLETFTKENYGICGLILPESKWTYSKGSSARPKIREFIEFVKNTERDFDFLSTNNKKIIFLWVLKFHQFVPTVVTKQNQ